MSVNRRLELLDGYRGFLAIIVVLNHIITYIETAKTRGDWVIFYPMGSTIGVPGFFILSSFLLTYRLLVDFTKAESLRLCLLKAIQYIIRRVFRVYLVFIIYWTLVHYGPPIFKGYYIQEKKLGYAEYSTGLWLNASLGPNHLWTIPFEIGYYFYIPMLSFVIAKLGKYWIHACILFAIILYDIDTHDKWVMFATIKLFHFNYWNFVAKYKTLLAHCLA